MFGDVALLFKLIKARFLGITFVFRKFLFDGLTLLGFFFRFRNTLVNKWFVFSSKIFLADVTNKPFGSVSSMFMTIQNVYDNTKKSIKKN